MSSYKPKHGDWVRYYDRKPSIYSVRQGHVGMVLHETDRSDEVYVAVHFPGKPGGVPFWRCPVSALRKLYGKRKAVALASLVVEL